MLSVAFGKKNDKGKKNSSSAFDLGYVQARSEWNKGSYSDKCTFESIADKFWSNQVCSTVINKCYEDFKFNSKMLKECKAGAKEFTAEQIRECLGSGATESAESCQGMGESAARLVASTYCKTNRTGPRIDFFPEFCVNNAIDKCRSDFVSAFSQLCGGELSDTAKSNYREDCDKQVRKMVRGTELPDC